MAAHKNKDGKPVKLTSLVFGHIDALRRVGESYDSCLRRHFGLPSKKGEAQPLETFFIIKDHKGSLIVTTKRADAKGAAVLAQARAKSARSWPVLTVREVPA